MYIKPFSASRSIVGVGTTPPNVLVPTQTGPGGRKSTQPFFRTTVPVQAGTQDVNFQDTRMVIDTGMLHKSALLGVLSELADPTFSFINPAFTYGGSGTALTLDGTNIGTDGQARAVAVYAADGTVI